MLLGQYNARGQGQGNAAAVIEQFMLNFTVPMFDPPWTPAQEDTRYRVEWGDDGDGRGASNTFSIDGRQYESGARVSTQVNERIAVDDEVTMTLVAMADYRVTYGGDALCEVLTRAPSVSPTRAPTQPDTAPPTESPPLVWIEADICSDGSDSAKRCECDGDEIGNAQCQGDESALLTLDFEEQKATHALTIRKYPSSFALDVTVTFNFSVSPLDNSEGGASPQDISPWGGTAVVKSARGRTELEFSAVLDSLLDETRETFTLEITDCRDSKGAQCHAVYPSRVTLVIRNSDTSAKNYREESNDFPDFLWVLLLGGTGVGGAVGYGAYTKVKNAHLAEEEGMQDNEDEALIDDLSAMGMKGDMFDVYPMFNPRAIGE